MALWQYQFLLVPQRDLFELGAVYHLPEEDLNSFSFWKKEDYSIEFFKPITNLLKSQKSWNKDIVQFGSLESTCIEIAIDSGAVSEVSIRVDYRSNVSAFLKELVAFCNQNSIALVDEENCIRLLDLDIILSVVADSPQAKKLNELKIGTNT